MTRISKRTFDDTNITKEINIDEMAEYCASQAAILQEKVSNKIMSINLEELSISDSLFYIEMGLKLESTCLEILDQKYDLKTKFRPNEIYKQYATLSKLKKENVEKLSPSLLLEYYLTTVSIEHVCRGLPEFKVQYSGQ